MFNTLYLLLFNFTNVKLLILFSASAGWDNSVEETEAIIVNPFFSAVFINFLFPALLVLFKFDLFHETPDNKKAFLLKYSSYYLLVAMAGFLFLFLIQTPLAKNYLTTDLLNWKNFPLVFKYHILANSIASILIYNKMYRKFDLN